MKQHTQFQNYSSIIAADAFILEHQQLVNNLAVIFENDVAILFDISV